MRTTTTELPRFGLELLQAKRSGVSDTGSMASPRLLNKEVAPFLKNLRKMLDVESPAIIRWTPDGHAFEIHDMEQMMNFVLPKYFKHRKYTSFQRQLNYFNFRKWTKSKAVVCTFSNEFFLRDQPELSWRISRKKSLHGSPSTGKHSPSSSSKATKSEPLLSGDLQPYWGCKSEPVAIHVPRPRAYFDLHTQAPFPSPTDTETMLPEHDYSARRYCEPQIMMESLDWIECLLPDVDRIEDDPYTYMHPSLPTLGTLKPFDVVPIEL